MIVDSGGKTMVPKTTDCIYSTIDITMVIVECLRVKLCGLMWRQRKRTDSHLKRWNETVVATITSSVAEASIKVHGEYQAKNLTQSIC